ncbi:hypothetical protein FRC07_006105 [Ceratobasidium sp. 392]|nr:hypothetical protein FRC07_006105 [Ceratobasidium sp. 392]
MPHDSEKHLTAATEAPVALPTYPAVSHAPRRPQACKPLARADARSRQQFYVTFPSPVDSQFGSSALTRHSAISFATRNRLWDSFFGLSAGPHRSNEYTERNNHSLEVDSGPEVTTKYLFWYGFVFPVFWLIGILILFISLRPEDAAHMDLSNSMSTPSIAQSNISSTDWELARTIERQWAYRCAIAFALFLFVPAGVVLMLWTAHVGVFLDYA